MTFKFALKAGCAALALAAGGIASAAPIYFDIGRDYSGVVNTNGNFSTELGQVCATCTSMKDEFGITYQSQTTILGAPAVGSLVSTNVGLSVGTLSNNRVTGFNPGETFTDSDNGYGGSRWQIGFSITGLAGQIVSMAGGVPSISYGPGLLEMFVSNDGGLTFNNFMDLKIYGGGATGLGTLLIGEADFTNVQAGYNNLVHSGTYSCMGSSGFFDIWTNCGGALNTLDIGFVSSFDTNVTASSIVPGVAPGTFIIRSNHDGSGVFSVPEPGSLALLGLALAGLGMTQRRRKVAAQ